MISKLTNRAVNEGLPATVEEALKLDCIYSTDELSKAADTIRLKWCGNKIHTCSIVNARSGRCSENCKWCAQAGCHNTGIQEYERIPKEVALKAYAVNKTRGASCFSMVTSGRKVLSKDIAYFCVIYKEMSEHGGLNYARQWVCYRANNCNNYGMPECVSITVTLKVRHPFLPLYARHTPLKINLQLSGLQKR